MKQITIVLLCILTIQVSDAQTYQDKPWELVGKDLTSLEVRTFLKEMGPTSDLDTQENLRIDGKEYKRWASKGISIVIDPYQKSVIEVYLHNNTKNFSPYPHPLFKELSFQDKKKKILAKLEGYKKEDGELSVYSYHHGTFCLNKGSSLFLGIETENSKNGSMKGDIQYIRHYIDLKKMYKAEWGAEAENYKYKYYIETSSDSAWGEIIHTIFDDQLFYWKNLKGGKIPNPGQHWGPEYNICRLKNPTNRKSKMLDGKIIIPMWDNKILLAENTDSVQNKMFAEMNYQAGSISDKIGRYFFDRSARFEITGDWYNVKDADVSETFVKIRDKKLNNTQTIRLYMYIVKDEEAINIYYDLYIYGSGAAYDNAIKKD